MLLLCRHCVSRWHSSLCPCPPCTSILGNLLVPFVHAGETIVKEILLLIVCGRNLVIALFIVHSKERPLFIAVKTENM